MDEITQNCKMCRKCRDICHQKEIEINLGSEDFVYRSYVGRWSLCEDSFAKEVMIKTTIQSNSERLNNKWKASHGDMHNIIKGKWKQRPISHYYDENDINDTSGKCYDVSRRLFGALAMKHVTNEVWHGYAWCSQPKGVLLWGRLSVSCPCLLVRPWWTRCVLSLALRLCMPVLCWRRCLALGPMIRTDRGKRAGFVTGVSGLLRWLRP